MLNRERISPASSELQNSAQPENISTFVTKQLESLENLTPEQIDKALDNYRVDLRLTKQTLSMLRQSSTGSSVVSSQIMSKYFQKVKDLEIMRSAALTVLDQVRRELEDVINQMQEKIKELKAKQ
ncbi:hypothetical protein KKG41_02945 [Patescibacteria group bacterium]|nr:hypothetical protein [Patescibacteria group bacterium]MBU1891048.1 hypothetical protein [Patescibacteria group bacterium]